MTITRPPTKQAFTLQGNLHEAARVRAFLRQLAAEELGFPPERTFDVLVAVSEATANAVQHAHGSGEVRVEIEVLGDRLEVSVRGTGEFQVPAPAEGREHRGLGLPLMATLSDHLALYSRPDGGTLVTLTFYLPGRHGPESTLPPSLVEQLAQNNLLDQVLSHLADAFAVYDEEWRVVYLNELAAERLGRPREELFEKVVWELLPDVVGRDCHEQWLRAAREQHVVTSEGYSPQLERWFEDRVFPFAGWVAVFSRDITGQQRAERDLRRSEERYRSLFEHMGEGFAFCRMVYENDQPVDFEYLAVNEAFGRLTGLRHVVGKRVSEVIPGIRESNPAIFEIYGRVSETGTPDRYEDYFHSLDCGFRSRSTRSSREPSSLSSRASPNASDPSRRLMRVIARFVPLAIAGGR